MAAAAALGFAQKLIAKKAAEESSKWLKWVACGCMGCVVLPFAVIAVLFALVGAALGSEAVQAQACDYSTTATGGTGGNTQTAATQKGNADIIIGVTKGLGLSQQAAVVAVAVALQESSLENLGNPNVPGASGPQFQGSGSDHYSVGLFQQQTGPFGTYWGTVQQVGNPSYATARFLQELVTKVPNWQSLPLTVAAQKVQGSAYPDAYAKWQGQATSMVGADWSSVSPITNTGLNWRPGQGGGSGGAGVGNGAGGTGTGCCPQTIGSPGAGSGSDDFTGKVSWFNDATTASGISAATSPGIAVRRPGTTYGDPKNIASLKGYWNITFPNGKTVRLQQIDTGPNQSTGRVVDVSGPAIPLAGYTTGNFPTDGTVHAVYVGQNPAGASPSSSPGSGSACAGGPGVAGYIDPLKGEQWGAARTDQGVDWTPTVDEPVKAIGAGVVTFSSMASGWPGGAYIVYKLTAGPKAGKYIYVAEHLTGLAAVGTVLQPGQTIAIAHPGYPWTEWGWSMPPGNAQTPATPYNGAADGTAMPGGKAFARFMTELGDKPLQNPGPGPDTV